MALGLLCRTPTGLVCVVSWHGLLGQVERLCSRERLQGGANDQYLAAAVAGLTAQLAANVVPLLHQAAVAARAGAGAGAARRPAPPPGGSSGASSGSSSGAGLQPLEALLALLGSAAFRTLVVCEGLVTGLADLLTREVGAPPGAAACDARAELKVRGVVKEGLGGGGGGWRSLEAGSWPGGHGCSAPLCCCVHLVCPPHPPPPTLRPATPGTPPPPPHTQQVQLLNAIDAVCSHPELLIEFHAPVLSHLLPALSAAGARTWEAGGRDFTELGCGWPRQPGQRGAGQHAGAILQVPCARHPQGPPPQPPSTPARPRLPPCPSPARSGQPARDARHPLLLPQAAVRRGAAGGCWAAVG